MNPNQVSARVNALRPWQALFAGICALVLSVGMARFAYTPMLPIMKQQAVLSYLAGGWLATANYAGYMTGALMAATTSNLRFKWMLYRFGLLSAVVCTFAMALTDNVWVWAVLRYLSGIAGTAGLLLASGFVLNWLINQGHAPRLGVHFIGVGAGIVVSGLTVALLGESVSWQMNWVGLGVVGSLFFLPAWFWMPEPKAVKPKADQAPPTEPSARWMGWMLASYFCAGFGFVISATFIVAILVKLPVFQGQGGWVWVLVGLAAMPSSFLWDKVAARCGAIHALLIAFGIQTVSVLLPVVSSHPWMNGLAAFLYGATFVGIVSLTLTLMGRLYPANPAKAMARLTLSYGVAQILAPAMAGYIAVRTDSYAGALDVTAVVMLLGMACLCALLKDSARLPKA